MQNKKLIMNRTPKEVPVNMHQRVLPARVTAMDDFNNPQVQVCNSIDAYVLVSHVNYRRLNKMLIKRVLHQGSCLWETTGSGHGVGNCGSH